MEMPTFVPIVNSDNVPPATAPAAPGGAVATAPAPSKPKVEHLPPYRVLLHNDDVNVMEVVVETIVGLTPLTLESAVEATLEAHNSGVALLLVTHQERAELYQEQFQSKKLVVTIEPVD